MSIRQLDFRAVAVCLCALVAPVRGATDCNGNGIPDETDLAAGTSLDCNENGIPDECELTLWQEELIASDAAYDDRFGTALALDGDWLLIGAPWEDSPYTSSGAVYAFRRDGSSWIEHQKLQASDAVWLHNFGSPLALDGDVAVIGAIHDNAGGPEAGAAYVFRYDGSRWNQERKLRASDAASWEYFGCAVAVHGDLIAVGSASNEAGGACCGSAYVFRWNGAGWVEEQKLLASDSAALDYFGAALAVREDVILVGAYGDDAGATDGGAAYVFAWNGSGWEERRKLVVPDAVAYDGFGGAIALDREIAVIGAPGDGGGAPGAAYVFQQDPDDTSAWTLRQKLVAADAESGDYFGAAVDFRDGALVVGAPWESHAGPSSGAAYLFRWNGASWTEQYKLTVSDAAAQDWFGYAVATDGELAAVGAVWGGTTVSDTGSTYLFHPPSQADCNDNEIPDACDIADGVSRDQNANGVPDDCDCPGDLDGDWRVDLADLAQLLGHYGATDAVTYALGDLDLNGRVDLADLAALLGHYGTGCP